MNSFDGERLRIQRAKMLYPPGTRIELGEMSDPYAPVPPGTRGTVKFVDDISFEALIKLKRVCVTYVQS